MFKLLKWPNSIGKLHKFKLNNELAEQRQWNNFELPRDSDAEHNCPSAKKLDTMKSDAHRGRVKSTYVHLTLHAWQLLRLVGPYG